MRERRERDQRRRAAVRGELRVRLRREGDQERKADEKKEVEGRNSTTPSAMRGGGVETLV